jgi:uncharacterized UBP type Zn finger protein
MPEPIQPRTHLDSFPSCEHVPGTRPIKPNSASCLECLDCGDGWVGLWLCLSCGWVACSDDSPKQHAKAHYQETDHPVAITLQHNPHQRWCYIHQRTV